MYINGRKRSCCGILSQDTGVTLIGTFQLLTAILLTIEALYYNVVLTTGPTIFLVLIYGSWSAYFVTHRTGNGITRDSHAWRTKLFYSYVIMIVILAKVIWALFML